MVINCTWLLSGNLTVQIPRKWNVTNETRLLIRALNLSLLSRAAKETSRSPTAGQEEEVESTQNIYIFSASLLSAKNRLTAVSFSPLKSQFWSLYSVFSNKQAINQTPRSPFISLCLWCNYRSSLSCHFSWAFHTHICAGTITVIRKKREQVSERVPRHSALPDLFSIALLEILLCSSLYPPFYPFEYGMIKHSLDVLVSSGPQYSGTKILRKELGLLLLFFVCI